MLEVIDLKIEIYDSVSPSLVVSDFDLSINEGEIVGIVGESGSGKSMSAHAIAGLLSRADMKKGGSISFEGEDLIKIPRARLRKLQGNDIGMVFQEPMTSLNPLKTVGWQVEEALRIHTDLNDKDRYERAIEALASVEIDDPQKRYRQYPHELSGGLRQRVMIAAALVCEPKLLIADEPTTALDVTIQAQIIELLKKINRERGTAILFISHDLSLVKSLCSRVLVMNKGCVVEQGPSDEVFSNPKMDYTKKLIEAIPKFEKLTDAQQVNKSERKLLLEMKNVSAYYSNASDSIFKKKKKEAIIKNISFSMYEGEIVGLVGESGCGKSTLGKTILGMLKEVEGEVVSLSNKPQMIFQDPYGSLNPAKTVGWILSEPLRIEGNYSEPEMRKRAIESLERVGLSADYADRKPRALSGGQRQRVCIALALMSEPRLIIADEPVSALDVTVEKQVLELLVRLNRELGIAILFISHDLKVVYEICSRILVMNKGEIVEEGSDKDIYFAPKHEYTKQLLKSAGLVTIQSLP